MVQVSTKLRTEEHDRVSNFAYVSSRQSLTLRFYTSNFTSPLNSISWLYGTIESWNITDWRVISKDVHGWCLLETFFPPSHSLIIYNDPNGVEVTVKVRVDVSGYGFIHASLGCQPIFPDGTPRLIGKLTETI